MISNVMKDYCYTMEEMAEIMKIATSTLKRRIYDRKNLPPYQKVGDEYLFPKNLFEEWVKAQPVEYQVKE